jgi:transketolase
MVDYNRIQLDGFVDETMPLDPLPEKWRANRWHTVQLDGHSIAELQGAFAEAAATKGSRPRSSPTRSEGRWIFHEVQS